METCHIDGLGFKLTIFQGTRCLPTTSEYKWPALPQVEANFASSTCQYMSVLGGPGKTFLWSAFELLAWMFGQKVGVFPPSQVPLNQVGSPLFASLSRLSGLLSFFPQPCQPVHILGITGRTLAEIGFLSPYLTTIRLARPSSRTLYSESGSESGSDRHSVLLACNHIVVPRASALPASAYPPMKRSNITHDFEPPQSCA